jgi:uncharacterized membrane protein YkvA (DUF1232 family)
MSTSIRTTDDYTKLGFWKKLVNSAQKGGKKVIEKALILYYTLNDSDTPKKYKAIIYGTLGYFIAPLDAIPDFAPVIGYSDDLSVIVATLIAVSSFVKDQHKELARQKIDKLFG